MPEPCTVLATLVVMTMDDKRIRYVARDVPDGKKIFIMKINALHNALSKAIKIRFKMENIYHVTFMF